MKTKLQQEADKQRAIAKHGERINELMDKMLQGLTPAEAHDLMMKLWFVGDAFYTSNRFNEALRRREREMREPNDADFGYLPGEDSTPRFPNARNW